MEGEPDQMQDLVRAVDDLVIRAERLKLRVQPLVTRRQIEVSIGISVIARKDNYLGSRTRRLSATRPCRKAEGGRAAKPGMAPVLSRPRRRTLDSESRRQDRVRRCRPAPALVASHPSARRTRFSVRTHLQSRSQRGSAFRLLHRIVVHSQDPHTALIATRKLSRATREPTAVGHPIRACS